MFGGEQPGIEDSEVGWDDGEEEEEDSYDLGDVQAVVSLEKVCQDRQCNKSGADDDACYRLCPWFVIVRKHLGSPSFYSITASLPPPVI
jgi:hypothetical protein